MIFESVASSYPVSQKANVISQEKVLRYITYLSFPCLCYQLRCNTLTFEWKKFVSQETDRGIHLKAERKEKKGKYKHAVAEFCYKFWHIFNVLRSLLWSINKKHIFCHWCYHTDFYSLLFLW